MPTGSVRKAAAANMLKTARARGSTKRTTERATERPKTHDRTTKTYHSTTKNTRPNDQENMCNCETRLAASTQQLSSLEPWTKAQKVLCVSSLNKGPCWKVSHAVAMLIFEWFHGATSWFARVIFEKRTSHHIPPCCLTASGGEKSQLPKMDSRNFIPSLQSYTCPPHFLAPLDPER